MSENSSIPPKHRSAKVSPQRLFLLRLCAIGLGAAFAFGISEIGLRLVGIGMPSLYVPDSYCGSRLRPSTSGVWTREGHGNIVVNSKGFRGPEVSTEKDAGVFRIAVLGDSYIEALQVNEDATMCGQLEHLLNSQNRVANRKYEVINCGVSGYGTAQELQLLRHYVLPLKPDAVLLGIYPENDIRNNLRSLEQDPARPYFTTDDHGMLILDDSFLSSTPYTTADSAYERRKAFVVNCSRVLQLLMHVKQRVFSSSNTSMPTTSVEAQLKTSVQDAIYAYSEPTNTEHQQAWQLTQRLLEEFCEQCRIMQIPVFVFTVSTPVQTYPDAELRQGIVTEYGITDLFYAQQRLQKICSGTTAKFYPLASTLQAEADKAGVPLHGFPNTAMGLGHWNESGNDAAARLLANWLKENEYLSPTIQPLTGHE